MAKLVPVPWVSYAVDRDQGISKAGSPMLRKHLVQMAWAQLATCRFLMRRVARGTSA